MRSIIRNHAVAYLIICAIAVSSDGQRKSKGNEQGYFGPVQIVRTESVEFSLKEGKVKRGGRKVDSIERFDKQGRLIERVALKDNGAILVSEKNFYDARGRLNETLLKHDRFVYLPDRVTYKYDGKGNSIEGNGYDTNGKLVNRNEYVYDEKGRVLQWTAISYHPAENSKPHRWTYTYDERGRKKEVLAFSDEGSGFTPTDSLGAPHRKLYVYGAGDKPEIVLSFKVDGSFAGLESTKYDRNWNEIEEVEYDATGSLKKRVRYTYKFDRFGNWIQQNTYKWVEENGQAAYQLSEISYQIIRFFR